MPLYSIHEGEFELPAGLRDASVNTLEYPRQPSPIRLFVSRMPAGGRALPDLVEERIVEQRRRVAGYALASRSERRVGEVPAAEVRSAFREGTVAMLQRVLHLVTRDRFVTLGVSGPEALAEEIDSMFEKAASTVTLRTRQEA